MNNQEGLVENIDDKKEVDSNNNRNIQQTFSRKQLKQKFEPESKFTTQTHLTTYGFLINPHSSSSSSSSSSSTVVKLDMHQADVKYYSKILSQKDSYDHYKKLASLSCWKT